MLNVRSTFGYNNLAASADLLTCACQKEELTPIPFRGLVVDANRKV